MLRLFNKNRTRVEVLNLFINTYIIKKNIILLYYKKLSLIKEIKTNIILK